MPDTILLYEFSPDKASVSLGGDNHIDSLIDLHVKINTRGPAAVVGGITITIPVGENDGSRLSANPLPDPVPGPTPLEGWEITVDEVNKSIVHITPLPKTDPPRPKALAGTIEFTLQDILVNKTVGIVPITVDEFAPSHIKATFQITKEDADRPVKKFYVTDEDDQELNPPVLYDLDQRVSLKWDCTDEGKSNYSYGLRTTTGQAWQPRDCLSRKQCYSCQDGIDGVLTDELSQSTTFALDVVKTDGERRRLHSILYTTVDLEMPVIRSKSVKAKHFRGRSVRLHWLADNAKRCELRLDEQMIDAGAPADTYKNGYYVSIGTGPGKYAPSLTAYARMGAATEAEPFLPVTVDPLTVIDTEEQLRLLAITADGRWAVGCSGPLKVRLIDLKEAQPSPSGVGFIPYDPTDNTIYNEANTFVTSVAFTPDGQAVLVHFVTTTNIANSLGKASPVFTSQLSVSKIQTGEPRVIMLMRNIPFNVFQFPTGIAITPDGIRSLITYAPDSVYVVNIPALNKELGFNVSYLNPTVIAATPDGRYGVVGLANPQGGSIGLLDLTTRQMTADPVAISPADPSLTNPAYPLAIAVSADSRRVFVVNSEGGNDNRNISVIDIVSATDIRRSATISSSGARPNSIALTTPAQGSPELAVIANGDGSLTVLKVDDLSAKPIHIPLDPGVEAGPIVISKTGGLNNHGVGLVATKKGVIRFDVDELPWSTR